MLRIGGLVLSEVEGPRWWTAYENSHYSWQLEDV